MLHCFIAYLGKLVRHGAVVCTVLNLNGEIINRGAALMLSSLGQNLLQPLLHSKGEVETIVQVGGLLELSPSIEAILVLTTVVLVFGTGAPSDAHVLVVTLTGPSEIRCDGLDTVIGHEKIGSASPLLVIPNRGHDGIDGGLDDRLKTLFVDGHLDGDVRKHRVAVTLQSRLAGAVVFVVAFEDAFDGSNNEEDAADDDAEEEDGEERKHGNPHGENHT